MKTCPFCAEDIQDAAIVCKHCRRDLPAPPATLTTSATGQSSEPPSALESGTITQPPPTDALKVPKQLLFGAFGIGFLLTAVSVGTRAIGVVVMWLVLAVALKARSFKKVVGSLAVAAFLGALGSSLARNPAPSANSSSSASPSSSAAATLIRVTDWSNPQVISNLCKQSDATRLNEEIKSRCVRAHLDFARNLLNDAKVTEARHVFNLALAGGVTRPERADVEMLLMKAVDEQQKKAEAKAKEERDARSDWVYDESQDQMGRKVKTAFLSSSNEINFDFPYAGNQKAGLMLRVHPNYGRDVILSIERGQFLCGIDDCTVEVRFDEGKPQTYTAGGAADHSTTMLFIRSYDRFVASARRAKRVSIEASFFQQGVRVFEFNTQNLKW